MLHYSENNHIVRNFQLILKSLTHLLSELDFTPTNLSNSITISNDFYSYIRYYEEIVDKRDFSLCREGFGAKNKNIWILWGELTVLSQRAASLCVCPFCRVGSSIPTSDVLLLILNSVSWLSDFVRPNTKDKTHI